MAEINPLSIIGNSNDPTLAQRTTDAASSNSAMRNALLQIAAQGRNQRANTSLQGGLTLDNTALGKNLDRQGPNFTANLDARRLSDLAGTDSVTQSNLAGAALNLGNLGQFPTPQATAAETVSPSNTLIPGLPLGVQKSAAQGSDAAKLTGKVSDKVQEKGFEIGGVKIGGSEVTTTKEKSTEGQLKSGATGPVGKATKDVINRATPAGLEGTIPLNIITPDLAKSLITQIQSMDAFKGQTIERIFMDETGQLVAVIDGVEYDLNQ